MGKARQRYRRIADLYTVGKELVVQPDPENAPDDYAVYWLQVLTPAERDEVRQDAYLSTKSLEKAMRRGDSKTMQVLLDTLDSMNRDQWRDLLVDWRSRNKWEKADTHMRMDDDWREEMRLVAAHHEVALGGVESDDELAEHDDRLARIEAEMQRFVDEYVDAVRADVLMIPDADLLDALKESYIEQKKQDRALAEWAVTEAWLSLRECEADLPADGADWDHSDCDHNSRAYETKAEVAALPEVLMNQFAIAIYEINMPEVEAKNSASAEPSSKASAQPSKAEASTGSTETGGRRPARGRSS